jgi:DNA-binding NtrC family response regulator
MNGSEPLVYVVDDDLSAREGTAAVIRAAGLATRTFASGEEFLAAPRARMPVCVLLDVSMPGLSGFDVQEELARCRMQLPIIFLTGVGDIPMTVRAVKAGAVDVLTKPCEDEHLLGAIRRCLASCVNGEMDPHLGSMVGQSAALQDVLRAIHVVAPTDAAVLIEGETGTGKGLVAQAIHDLSNRCGRAFVKVNCASIPAALLESELFGHEKGAFTGAIAQRIGRFEAAHGGTIFLDEIGEVPLELQPKLLRVLQDGEFERLGSTRTLRSNARLIAATNRDLKAMVLRQAFRSDLYYRLNVFPIRVPPLRERKNDIPHLVRHFLREFGRRNQREIDTIHPDAMQALVRYSWPGNIRQLENLIERAVIISKGPVLNVPLSELDADVPRAFAEGYESLQDSLKQTERTHILRAMEEANWIIAGPNGAASRLGMKRSTLHMRMKKLGIRVERRPARE